MKRKLKTPALQNKNGPITIIQRSKKDPITFQGRIAWPGFKGSVEVRITTSTPGWRALRFKAFLPKLFGEAFLSDVIEPVYDYKIRDRPAKVEWINQEHKKMKLLAALLFLFFSRCKNQNDDAILSTIKTMARLYPDEKVFQLSPKAKSYTGKKIKSFKSGYIYDGKDIIQSMVGHKNSERGWILETLYIDFEKRLQQKEEKALKKDLLLAYNILYGAMVRFFDDIQPDEFKSKYLSDDFINFAMAFEKELVPTISNCQSA